MSDNNPRESDSSSKTQIILGILTLLGVLSGAVFSNWDKIFPQSVNLPVNSSNPSGDLVKLLASEDLKVYADSTKGTSFKNKEDRYVKVSFKASTTDRWLAIPEDISNSEIPEHAKGYLSARGDLEFEANKTVCRVPLGALIVVIGERRECTASGEEGSFELTPGETAYFLMNDVPGLYKDNRGFVTVQIKSFSR